jgi:HEAT repeat protein
MGKSRLNFALAAGLLAAVAGSAVAQEARFIAVLQSGATQKEKADACRALAHTATKQSVPVLAALLGDEKLAHMARYALETIPDPSVDEALREALGKLKGRPLLGVIGSLGVRRDARAVPAMAGLLADPDGEVARSAARALGNIGTVEAAHAIVPVLDGASPANRVAFCEGLFRCAEALSAAGQAAPSQALYELLRGVKDAPQQVRAGALRGAILTRGKVGIPLLLEAVRGADYVLVAAAARTAMELPGTEVTAALAGALAELPADKQILLVNTLGYRGDASAAPALLALASRGPEAVRLAAVRNLTHLGYAPALPLLAELSLAGEGDLAAAARAGLGNFPGKGADAALLAMLAHKAAKVRALAVELVGQRNMAGSTASLLRAAEDPEQAVRLAALKALNDRAGLAELPAVLGLLVKAPSSAESQAAEGVLAALCARQSAPAGGNVVIVKAQYGKLPEGPLADVTRQVAALVKAGAVAIEATNGNFGDPANGTVKKLRVDYTVNGVPASKTVGELETLTLSAASTPPAIVEAIAAAMAEARGEAKRALVGVLRSAGGPRALAAVKAAAADRDPEVKETALRALCDWPTPDALPLLAALVESPPTKTVKVLALRGFVRLVSLEASPAAQKLAQLDNAMAMAERNEEKWLVLSALGEIPTVDALATVASHLDNPALREEACQAAVAIAEKIATVNRAEVAAAMRQVAQRTADKKLAARAKALAQEAKN